MRNVREPAVTGSVIMRGNITTALESSRVHGVHVWWSGVGGYGVFFFL